MRWWISTIFACLLLCLPCVTVGAQTDPKNKGLLISPPRSYSSFDAGTDVRRSFKVSNLTDKPVDVSVSVKGFSVIDYAYDYHFGDTPNSWVRPVENHFSLSPYETHDIVYQVAIPNNAPPGGQYYSFFVSTNLTGNGISSTVQAVHLLYLTVNGDLVRTSNVESSSIPRLVFTPQIPYSLDVKNTGNIHYFAYISATVDGIFYHDSPPGVSQLLMPNSTRLLEYQVGSPLLPGIYKVTYGYTPDEGSRVERSSWIVFMPPWFIVLVLLVSFAVTSLVRHRKRKTRTDT